MKRTVSAVIIIFSLAAVVSGGKKFRGMDREDCRLPIIYSDKYNIRFLGFQKLHPFDTEKYSRIYKHLQKQCGYTEECFITPSMVTEEELLKIHTQEYLQSLHSSHTVAMIAEMSILNIAPHYLLQKTILNPMKYATGGTIQGAALALREGWAINLSGGYHHAKRGSGDGFCFFADVPLAMTRLWEKDPSLRAMIIDLDAHQGNGFEDVFGDDSRIFILDAYNRNIYPGDTAAMKYIDKKIPLEPYTGDSMYLKIIKEAIPSAIKKAKPDIIFYNAGTDILTEDPLGMLNISASGIIERDGIVFTEAVSRKIPILMVLSGGYTKKSGDIIGRSIENILKNILKVECSQTQSKKKY